MTSETWKPIVGYEGLYEVSDFGRVRGLDRRDAGGRKWRGQIRALAFINGYAHVTLCSGRGTNRSIHSLVLEAFVGPRPEGMQACHRNGVRADNRLENLRWGTPQSNTYDKERHGTVRRGREHPSTRLNDSDIDRVVSLRRSGFTQPQIARRLGISNAHVSNILRGKHWNKREYSDAAAKASVRSEACKGVRNGRARLTEIDVERIRDLYRNGCGPTAIAAWLSVSASTVVNVAKRYTWRHLP